MAIKWTNKSAINDETGGGKEEGRKEEKREQGGEEGREAREGRVRRE